MKRKDRDGLNFGQNSNDAKNESTVELNIWRNARHVKR
jgi:hypothetical protein